MMNAVLRALLESYLQISIQMWIGWQIANLPPTLEARINFLIVIVLTAFCLIFPFGQHRFLFKHQNFIKSEEFQQRYGSLTQNVELSRFEGLAFSFYFLVRRLTFAYTIVYLNRSIVIQVLAIDALSTGLLAYFFMGRPMVDKLNNFIQVFNEMFILICAWSLFLFTDYVPDPKLRHSFGESYLYIIAFNFATNLMFLLTTLLISLIRTMKSWWRRRQMRKRV